MVATWFQLKSFPWFPVCAYSEFFKFTVNIIPGYVNNNVGLGAVIASDDL